MGRSGRRRWAFGHTNSFFAYTRLGASDLGQRTPKQLSNWSVARIVKTHFRKHTNKETRTHTQVLRARSICSTLLRRAEWCGVWTLARVSCVALIGVFSFATHIPVTHSHTPHTNAGNGAIRTAGQQQKAELSKRARMVGRAWSGKTAIKIRTASAPKEPLI